MNFEHYTVSELAKKLRVTPTVIRAEIKRGNLPMFQLKKNGNYRIHRADFEKYILLKKEQNRERFSKRV